jgi:cyclopropane-fatty-acyl-phospholipid synthase
MSTSLSQRAAGEHAVDRYRGASKDAIQHHYDLSNDFYALWLDRTRTYSCALWEGPDDTLDAAQARKLDHLIDAALTSGSSHVLDIGCGWGGAMREIVERSGIDRVTGLTLSDAQARYIEEIGDERLSVRVENWRDHDGENYDAIISIGAFEHFAGYGMTRAARLDAYRDFFRHCHKWLAPGRRLVLQTNVKGNNVRLDRHMLGEFRFVIDQIFRESELPWISEIFESSERRFDVLWLRNDPDHYSRTCQVWLDRLRANRERAQAIAGAESVADYERYLAACVEAFDRRHLGLVRVAFARV